MAVSVTEYIYLGASGRKYSYRLFDAEDFHLLPLPGGTYIFALNDISRTPVFIEAANSVRASVLRMDMEYWKLAKTVYGAELVFIHIDPELRAHDRDMEKWDLIVASRPAMNTPGMAV